MRGSDLPGVRESVHCDERPGGFWSAGMFELRTVGGGVLRNETGGTKNAVGVGCDKEGKQGERVARPWAPCNIEK